MKLNRISKVTLVTLLLLLPAVFAFSAGQKEAGQLDVVVFVPGVSSGSPIYEMLVAGAKKAVAEVPNATLKVVEAGYNQAEWLDKLMAIAETGEFELIVSSNPSLPELCARVAQDYPEQKFFIADAYLAGNKSIHTVLYNQKEQAYMVGYLAALYTQQTGGSKIIGLVAAQSYPTMDRLIIPGFEAGMRAVDPAFRLEYREIGNWYDANKAAELTASILDLGARVVLPIAGGAGQGVLAAAGERGAKVVWFDGDGYQLAPDTVIGCAELAQDRLVAERVKLLLIAPGSLYGRADIVSAKDGYIFFSKNGEGYRKLGESLRRSFESAVENLAKGQPDFTLSSF